MLTVVIWVDNYYWRGHYAALLREKQQQQAAGIETREMVPQPSARRLQAPILNPAARIAAVQARQGDSQSIDRRTSTSTAACTSNAAISGHTDARVDRGQSSHSRAAHEAELIGSCPDMNNKNSNNCNHAPPCEATCTCSGAAATGSACGRVTTADSGDSMHAQYAYPSMYPPSPSPRVCWAAKQPFIGAGQYDGWGLPMQRYQATDTR